MRRVLKIVVLLVVPFLLTGCLPKKDTKSKPISKSAGLETSPKPSTSPVTTIVEGTYLTIEPEELAENLAATRQLAEEKVKAWQADAVLYHLSVTLPADLAAGQATEVYTFGSKGDAYNWWTITSSGKTGKSVRAIIPKEDYLGTELKPIPTQFWKINYIEALQLAQAAGGGEYLASYPDARINLGLSVSQPKDYLWWSVEYQASDQPALRILINPATKEAVNESGVPITAVPSPTNSPN